MSWKMHDHEPNAPPSSSGTSNSGSSSGHRSGTFKLEVRIKVLTSQHEDMLFRVRVQLTDAATAAVRAAATSAPIKVISKKDLVTRPARRRSAAAAAAAASGASSGSALASAAGPARAAAPPSAAPAAVPAG